MRKDKESNKKDEQKSLTCFDENYFYCRLVCKGINTELIRLHAEVKESKLRVNQVDSRWMRSNASGSLRIPTILKRYRMLLRSIINLA